jgi:general secretion pathway protein A
MIGLKAAYEPAFMLALLIISRTANMYSDYFQLNQAPFSIAPDPRYIFLSNGHREALAHLLYGVKNGGGVVLLTGEIGAGKTMVCRHFLEHLPSECSVAYIFNPKLTIIELLQSICEEFRIDAARSENPPESIKGYIDLLSRYLVQSFAQGRHNVVIIDEAQNLSGDVLEQLRLLTNLETNERKLLQIVLIGQPELRTLLDQPELQQLSQRVIARFHLTTLSERETAGYVRHRLSVAGMHAIEPFGSRALKRIYRLAQGVPRNINLLCDRALSAMFAEGGSKVTSAMIDSAAAEVFGARRAAFAAHFARRNKRFVWGAGIVAYTVVVCGITWGANQEVLIETFRNSLIPIIDANRDKIRSMDPIPVAIMDTVKRETEQMAKQVLRQSDGFSTSGLTEENDAYRALGRLWGVELPNEEACAAARDHDLSCYRSSRGISGLRLLDRPALLSMRDKAGRAYQVILTGLSSTDATVQAGGASQTVSLLVLARYFSGDFTTLWRAPPWHRGHLEYGDKGWEVDWIAAQLARVNGEVAPSTPRNFDLKMIHRVREFQRTQGLDPDGIVGPMTFMHLNRVAGVAEPRLIKEIDVSK